MKFSAYFVMSDSCVLFDYISLCEVVLSDEALFLNSGIFCTLFYCSSAYK